MVLPDRSMYALVDNKSPTASPNDSWAEFPGTQATGSVVGTRARRRALWAFVVLEAALLVLACVGGVYMVRIHITGSLHAVPSYTQAEIRDAGWMRPITILESPSVPPTPLEPSYDPSSPGRVEMFNLSSYPTTASSLHLLILTPLQNSAKNLPRLFRHLDNFTHPRINTSLGFLVGDEDDTTGADLRQLVEARRHEYRKITLLSHSFGLELPKGEGRHLRSLLGKARSVLLMSTLQGDHDWVLWLDSDVSEVPPTIFEDLLFYGNTGVEFADGGVREGAETVSEFNDIVTPNICRRRNGRPDGNLHGYDMNNWLETEESRKKKAKLSEEQLLVEGGPSRLDTKRTHLTELRVEPNISWVNTSPPSLHSSLDSEPLANSSLYDSSSPAYIGRRVELDGVGGVATLVRAQAHRLGAVFPGWIIDHQLETEGFAVIARKLGARIVGLPNYVVVHQ
ncbi:hypothetical protein P7C70_g7142, partial [Phenoliferia sp. Uapishka_3]